MVFYYLSYTNIFVNLASWKIELAKLILSTNNIRLINQIKSLFKSSEENWMDELPAYVKKGIAESIEQANRGEFISYHDVKKEIAVLLKNEIWRCINSPCERFVAIDNWTFQLKWGDKSAEKFVERTYRVLDNISSHPYIFKAYQETDVRKVVSPSKHQWFIVYLGSAEKLKSG